VLEFITKFFTHTDANPSKKVAKDRLRLVLVHDRANVSPQLLEDMKGDLIKVISSYLDIDESGLEVSFNREAQSVALVASIPVIRIKRSY